MPRSAALRITMSAREVIAAGSHFRAWGETFSDPGVARDEISALRAGSEPLVLRVLAVGGTKAERGRVAGDWLCDADGGPPKRIPDPAWRYNSAARDWSSVRTWLDAWETCSDPTWLLHAASQHVSPSVTVFAACACVRAVLNFVPPGEDRPRIAVDTAEAWTRGEATKQEADRAAHAAYDFAVGVDVVVEPSYAESAVGRAAASLSPFLFVDAPEFAASAIGYRSPMAQADRARERALVQMADIVRAKVPTIALLRAVSAVSAVPRR